MSTSWKIRDKSTGGSGPTWDAMDTSSTDDYDQLSTHKWDWASSWGVFASASEVAGGNRWSAVSYTWGTDPTTYQYDQWTITTNTKIQQATES